VLRDLESLQPRELVRVDEQARSYLSGLDWSRIPRLSVDAASPSENELWRVLALMSGDGYQRERAVRSVSLRPLTVRLVVIRCIDWVAEVRDAGLDRLAGCESRLMVAALPLAEQLARERSRGKSLGSLLDTSVPDEDLRHAYRLSDAQTRRAA
jgi:hypothetical protein